MVWQRQREAVPVNQLWIRGCPTKARWIKVLQMQSRWGPSYKGGLWTRQRWAFWLCQLAQWEWGSFCYSEASFPIWKSDRRPPTGFKGHEEYESPAEHLTLEKSLVSWLLCFVLFFIIWGSSTHPRTVVLTLVYTLESSGEFNKHSCLAPPPRDSEKMAWVWTWAPGLFKLSRWF